MTGYTKPQIALQNDIQDSVDLVCVKGTVLWHLLDLGQSYAHSLKWPRPQVWVFGQGICPVLLLMSLEAPPFSERRLGAPAHLHLKGHMQNRPDLAYALKVATIISYKYYLWGILS